MGGLACKQMTGITGDCVGETYLVTTGPPEVTGVDSSWHPQAHNMSHDHCRENTKPEVPVRSPPAGDQPQLIQGIRRRDGLGDYLYANQRCQE